jgi:hypothetical protein
MRGDQKMRRRKKEEAKEGDDDGEGLGIKNSPTYVRWLDGISRHIALIFVVILICFHNALDGDFVFDDTFAVRDNKDVTGGMKSNIACVLQCHTQRPPRPKCDVPASICPEE